MLTCELEGPSYCALLAVDVTLQLLCLYARVYIQTRTHGYWNNLSHHDMLIIECRSTRCNKSARYIDRAETNI